MLFGGAAAAPPGGWPRRTTTTTAKRTVTIAGSRLAQGSRGQTKEKSVAAQPPSGERRQEQHSLGDQDSGPGHLVEGRRHERHQPEVRHIGQVGDEQGRDDTQDPYRGGGERRGRVRSSDQCQPHRPAKCSAPAAWGPRPGTLRPSRRRTSVALGTIVLQMAADELVAKAPGSATSRTSPSGSLGTR